MGQRTQTHVRALGDAQQANLSQVPASTTHRLKGSVGQDHTASKVEGLELDSNAAAATTAAPAHEQDRHTLVRELATICHRQGMEFHLSSCQVLQSRIVN